jgi:hypothetical protein
MPRAITRWLRVKGKPVEIHLTNPGDYDGTDAAGLADGGLLVLERRYRIEGVKSRLRLVRRDELKPETRIEGEMLFDAASATNHEVDNMRSTTWRDLRFTPARAARSS